MLKGRLGLETARVPHADRHGVMWLGRGTLYVEDGTLHFATVGYDRLPAGDYVLPFQLVSCLMIQPGVSVTHDALRLMARHGTGLVAVGEAGVREYASMPYGPDDSARARRQVAAWADPDRRIAVVRRMYAWRLGEVLPATDLNALRGIEGARMKRTYQLVAEQYGIRWGGRRYDRADPNADDAANQAINHASSALRGVAMVAVAATGAIPQLGFIHEDSGIAFALDIADLFRDSVLLPVAFGAVKEAKGRDEGDIERAVRKRAVDVFRREQVVTKMIDRIKALLDDNDSGGDAQLT
jgi:CRISPR-associated protein Cas1